MRFLVSLVVVLVAAASMCAMGDEESSAPSLRGEGGFYRGSSPDELARLRPGATLSIGAPAAPRASYHRDESWYRDTDSQRRRFDDVEEVRVIRLRTSPSYRYSYYGSPYVGYGYPHRGYTRPYRSSFSLRFGWSGWHCW